MLVDTKKRIILPRSDISRCLPNAFRHEEYNPNIRLLSSCETERDPKTDGKYIKTPSEVSAAKSEGLDPQLEASFDAAQMSTKELLKQTSLNLSELVQSMDDHLAANSPTKIKSKFEVLERLPSLVVGVESRAEEDKGLGGTRRDRISTERLIPLNCC